jgi:hypothetical protein
MRTIYFIFFCLLVINLIDACKKQNSINFPKGNWILKSFVINKVSPKGYSCSFNQASYQELLENFVLIYDGKNHLVFSSNHSDKLKIIESKVENEKLFFTPNNNPYYGKIYGTENNITLTVRTDKLKKLKFIYSLINDTILIGEFWKDNQAISRYDAPNFCSGVFNLSNLNIKGETTMNFESEILGVYHLQK